MTNENIAVEIAKHQKEIGSLKHRMNKQEENANALTELVASVRVLANNMENMAKEQREQGSRLERLEREPVEDSNNNKRIVVSCIISTVVTAIVTFIISGGLFK